MAEIARRLDIGGTSVRRILKRKGDSGLEKEIPA